MRFFVEAELQTKGNRQKIFRRGKRQWIGPTGEVVAAQKEVNLKARYYAPADPLEGPVKLDVTIVVRVPPSYPPEKRERALSGELWPDTPDKGDRGNHLKLLEDALEDAGFYHNDAQICAGDVSKVFGEVSGYWVTLEKIE